jgi:hypothetical protein
VCGSATTFETMTKRLKALEARSDIDHSRTKTKSPQTTDVIDKSFLRRTALCSLDREVEFVLVPLRVAAILAAAIG